MCLALREKEFIATKQALFDEPPLTEIPEQTEVSKRFGNKTWNSQSRSWEFIEDRRPKHRNCRRSHLEARYSRKIWNVAVWLISSEKNQDNIWIGVGTRDALFSNPDKPREGIWSKHPWTASNHFTVVGRKRAETSWALVMSISGKTTKRSCFDVEITC